MGRKIQNQDVKTLTDLTGAGASASDLINDTKIYMTGAAKQLSAAVTDRDLVAVMVGDSGSGGTKGLVPAPAAGDTAANKFLKADGTWAAAGGGGGANQFLSNLTDPTSVSETLFMAAGKTLRLPNNTYLLGRNVSDSADLNVIRVTAGNQIQVGGTLIGASSFNLGTSAVPFGAAFLRNGLTMQTSSGGDGLVIRASAAETLPASGASAIHHIRTNELSKVEGGDFGIFTGSGSASANIMNIHIETGNNSNATGPTGSLNFRTGNASGSGSSGEILLRTGTSATGTRGKVIIDALSARLPTVAADPGAPVNGDIWYNTTSNQLKAYVNGSTVVLA